MTAICPDCGTAMERLRDWTLRCPRVTATQWASRGDRRVVRCGIREGVEWSGPHTVGPVWNEAEDAEERGLLR